MIYVKWTPSRLWVCVSNSNNTRLVTTSSIVIVIVIVIIIVLIVIVIIPVIVIMISIVIVIVIIQYSSKGGAVETGCSDLYYRMLYISLVYNTTPIHRTPLPLHPPCNEYPIC